VEKLRSVSWAVLISIPFSAYLRTPLIEGLGEEHSIPFHGLKALNILRSAWKVGRKLKAKYSVRDVRSETMGKRN